MNTIVNSCENLFLSKCLYKCSPFLWNPFMLISLDKWYRNDWCLVFSKHWYPHYTIEIKVAIFLLYSGTIFHCHMNFEYFSSVNTLISKLHTLSFIRYHCWNIHKGNILPLLLITKSVIVITFVFKFLCHTYQKYAKIFFK